MLPSAPTMPYIPLIGASIESTTIRAGFASTAWYVPGIGVPSSLKSYRPAGMIQVRPATTTISRKRIVYAEGRLSRRRRFAGTASMAGAAAVMVGRRSLQPRRLARGAGGDDGRLDPRPVLAGDDAAQLAERADRGRSTG